MDLFLPKLRKLAAFAQLIHKTLINAYFTVILNTISDIHF